MSVSIGTPFSLSAKKVMLLGSGELGKEVVLELQRYGVEVIAVDSYENAPGMQVADRCHVISMLDEDELRRVIELEKPNLIVPEVEAIATNVLKEIEIAGISEVTPNANATILTMNREGIRRLAAEEVGLKTSNYRFASTKEEYLEAIEEVGIPFVIKPIMSSSGKGQTTVKNEAQLDDAWTYAQEGGRAGGGKAIVEGFVDFDYEITLLTVRHSLGTSFLDPIGHIQVDGDYRESWQPQPMTESALKNAQEYAEKITTALGGRGIFGVELFIKGDEVIFSEVSPRPHDTGMVTMISQDLSQFALHARAILGLPIPNIKQRGPSASSVILVEGDSDDLTFSDLGVALQEKDTQIRLFGKPQVAGKRRMGVALALGENIDEAREKAKKCSNAVKVTL